MSARRPTAPKRYWIAIKGHDGREVVATTPGAARWGEYRAWREAGFARSWPNTISFGDFLRTQIETFHHLGPVALFSEGGR